MNDYQEKLKAFMDRYAHLVYKLTLKIPMEERFGLVSQMRRAALSIILNYIEGFARGKRLVKSNFWEISYGSYQESKYLVQFCLEEEYISVEDEVEASRMLNQIGAMLWTDLSHLRIK